MRLLSALFLAICVAAPAGAQPRPAQVLAKKHMIVASNALAATAGLSVLREGGSAADAVVAAQMVLALVEPQSSGLGGGAVALSYNAADGTVQAWDGRETAPAAAGPGLFLAADGTPMTMAEAGSGGRAVGVPGAIRMLEALQRAQGKLPWDRLFAHAIRLAESGFAVSPRLAAAIVADAARLKRQPAAAAYFFAADGAPVAAGSFLTNKPLAETLRAIATGGADALNKSPIAAEIATAVRADANAGLLTADDLAAYTPRTRAALCGLYRGQHVCGMGPPSAGGVEVLQILGLLQHFNLTALAPEGPETVHLLIEAEKLAAADRALYLADSDFQPVPVHGLLDPAYVTTRAQSIDPGHANPAPRAGNPDWGESDLAAAPPQPEHGTSQIVAIDDFGNAVSLTSTVEDSFGSGLMVRGFMLNDALTNFAFVPSQDGRLVANRVEGGRRPLTSMAPTLVFGADGKLRVVAGTSGGDRIIGFMAQMLVRMIDHGRGAQDAVAAPHSQARGTTTELEAETPAATLADALQSRGQSPIVAPVASGQQAIMATADGLAGGADPRSDGVALGD